MSYLLTEILVYLIVAAGIGAAVGWFIRHRQCSNTVENMQLTLDRSQSAFNNQAKQLNSYKKLYRNLTAKVETQNSELKLMISRWQTSLVKAKTLPVYQSWLKKVQAMYQTTRAERDRFTNLANQNAAMYADAVQKIKRLNEHVTNQEAKVTNSEKDIRDLYGMVAQVQSKWRHDRIDTLKLRDIHPKMEEKTNKAQWRLAELDKKYTEQLAEQETQHKSELEELEKQHKSNVEKFQKRIDELTPLEGDQPGQDTKFNRFMDKIRLVGTSKNTVLGRTYKQIEEVKLEASQKERVFVDTCEEKDAIIDDLREQVRTAENRAQAACSAQIQESSTKIHTLESEIKELNQNAAMLREHEHTIEALKNKLATISSSELYKTTSSEPVKADIEQTKESKVVTGFNTPVTGLKIAAAKVQDELQIIKGIGPKMEKTLNDIGIYSFEQIANLAKDDIKVLADKLGGFPGRIDRDKWISQSKIHFQKKYG